MTQDEIIELARQAGCPMANMMPMYFTDTQLLVMLEAFAALVASAEREACAKLFEQGDEMGEWYSYEVAKAIRARGQA